MYEIIKTRYNETKQNEANQICFQLTKLFITIQIYTEELLWGSS